MTHVEEARHQLDALTRARIDVAVGDFLASICACAVALVLDHGLSVDDAILLTSAALTSSGQQLTHDPHMLLVGQSSLTVH